MTSQDIYPSAPKLCPAKFEEDFLSQAPLHEVTQIILLPELLQEDAIVHLVLELQS